MFGIFHYLDLLNLVVLYLQFGEMNL